MTRSNACSARATVRSIRWSRRDLRLSARSSRRAVSNCLRLLLHLALARGERGEALVEAHDLIGGVGLHRVEPLDPRLEVELAGDGGLGEVVAALAQSEARLLVEIGDLAAQRLLLLPGVDGARRLRLMLGADLVEGALDLADRLAQQAGAAGALERVDRFLGARGKHAPNAKVDRLGHCPAPS